MKSVYCKIVGSNYKHNEGMMFIDENLTFESLVSWVYRNCIGCLKIEITPNKEISVEFEDRFEIYFIKEI